MTKSGSPWCWHCGKRLGSLSARADNRLTWSVVADQIGHEHRVHKACAASSLELGVKFVRDEVEPYRQLPPTPPRSRPAPSQSRELTDGEFVKRLTDAGWAPNAARQRLKQDLLDAAEEDGYDGA